MNRAETVKRWTDEVSKLIVGRKIVGFRYLTEQEQQDLDWYAAAPVLVLDDGNQIFASADDEGNNAGALFTTFESMQTIPVI